MPVITKQVRQNSVRAFTVVVMNMLATGKVNIGEDNPRQEILCGLG